MTVSQAIHHLGKNGPFATSILVCLAILTAPVVGQQITPVSGGQVTSPIIAVNTGPGDQTDPHVSGNLASYTDLPSSRVRYFDFLTSSDIAIPAGAPGDIDTLSNIDGSRISFSRQMIDRRGVFVFDTAASTLTEIDPQPGSARFNTAIGGDRVAFLDASGPGGSDILVHDLLTHTTTNLTSGTSGINGNPAVAPDGNTVVWELCDAHFVTCEIRAAVWSASVNAWTVSTVAATPPSNNLNPDTDGAWIVYDSDRPSATARDIYFQPAGGGVERQLAIAGQQRNPSISQGVIAFEANDSPVNPADLFVYVMATNTLYQVTSTPTIDESLNDVSVLPNGDIRVVWAANDGLGGQSNIYATTFMPASGIHYEICPLYDTSVAKKSGSAYPIKLRLCDGNGNNLSSSSIVVHAVSVTRTSTNTPAVLDDTGNANPDFDFRYDSGLAGYIFNLNTKGYTTGTYNLNFTAGADPAVHVAPFAVK